MPLFDQFRRSRRAEARADAAAADHSAALLERFDALVTALPVGVIVVGEDGRVTVFNPAAAEIFAVPRERAIGRTLIESVRSFELDRRLSNALRSGAEQTAELTYNVGSERRLEVTTRPLRGAEPPREAVAVVHDITRVRELEAIRRDFVSNVSHELRTPLTSVKIIVETLQGGVDATAQTEFLNDIARETDRMIALVGDLLGLAKLESGAPESPFAPVDLCEVCREVVATQALRAKQLNIDLQVRTPDDPIEIEGDRAKLVQVVVNLLDNALRITPPGGHVRVGVKRDDGHAELYVSDDGPGIPSSALPHIFERFYVVDRSRARSATGTGLGLAIVKHIIELHAGTVVAESELGVGTTFRCRFKDLRAR
ncbi:MAG: PAS domain-containing protein [Candidatus Eremiobacteraeota bacterium]|nr:PAS domain-containing protein [Candidatus Eremiobacteraeota bacterium]